MAINNMKRLVLLVLICVLFTYNCETPPGGDPATFISGIVTDSLSGQPIDSSLIMLQDTTKPLASAYTDTLGAYIVSPFGYKRFVVFCSKVGYKTKWTAVRSTEDNVILDSVNFQLSQE